MKDSQSCYIYTHRSIARNRLFLASLKKLGHWHGASCQFFLDPCSISVSTLFSPASSYYAHHSFACLLPTSRAGFQCRFRRLCQRSCNLLYWYETERWQFRPPAVIFHSLFYNRILGGNYNITVVSKNEKWQCNNRHQNTEYSSPRESPSVRGSNVGVYSLPRLNCVVNALLHAQRDERQRKQSVHAHGTPRDTLDDARRHPALVRVAERRKWDHRRGEGDEPRGHGAVIEFLHRRRAGRWRFLG